MRKLLNYRLLSTLAQVATVVVGGFVLGIAQASAACTAGTPVNGLPESTPTSAFVDNNDGTQTHSLSGLMWDRCSLGQSWDGAHCVDETPGDGWSAELFTWQDALQEVVARNAANYLGHNDWRLPNTKELLSIVESCGMVPSINTTVFPDTPVGLRTEPLVGFWSSSTYFSYGISPLTTEAWYVGFMDGISNTSHKSNLHYVRLVRGGEGGADDDVLKSVTTLSVEPAAVAAGGSITLTASVTGMGPTGAIQFFESNNPLACDGGNQNLVAGEASCVINNMALGTYTYTATYTGDAYHMPSTSEPLIYVVSATLDVDADGEDDALTDGLLVIRYLFGFSGSSLVTDAVDMDNCHRCTADLIEPYLAGLVAANVLDIDDSAATDALTDGLLVIRYLFGFRGAALVEDAVDLDNCTAPRCDAPGIEAYLGGL